MPVNAEFIAVTIDCPEPPVLAAFYRALTGAEITYDTEEAAAVLLPGGTNVYFQKAAEHRAPRWPDAEHPQQFHLDFYVDDLDKAEAAAREAGAGRPDFQPGGERWRVLTDPAGHPFCLCVRSE
ncbi:VOC family protein [Spirillospora sp. NPDC029432]|uniref:VOC family protein n=1 Tax=Spirillospora sp. NPDC029432 TaxID=3154599 RepID=UPI0034513209